MDIFNKEKWTSLFVNSWQTDRKNATNSGESTTVPRNAKNSTKTLSSRIPTITSSVSPPLPTKKN